VIPTRGWYPCEVVGSWEQIQWPMNHFHSGRLEAKGYEVAAAYNLLFDLVTTKKSATEAFKEAPGYGDRVYRAPWVFTCEEDNIIPPYAIQQLFKAIHECPDCGREIGVCCAAKRVKCAKCREWRCPKGHKGYDAVSGLYSVKTDPPVPMAFGHPSDPEDMRPRSVTRAIKKGAVLEVNGIPMGCAIWRKEMFRKVSRPWFDTASQYTQDLYFCKKAKREAGARFAVHTGVLVGHLDVTSGEVI
jgi:hypothetical protein